MSTPIDYQPLLASVSKEEIALFKKQSKERGEPWASSAGTIFALVVIGLAAAWLLWTTWSSGLIVAMLWLPGGTFALLAIAAVLAGIGYVTFRFVAGGNRWEGLLRRTRFAAANGLVYVHQVAAPAYPGAIFGLGNSRQATGNYRAPFAPELDIGNYEYTTGSGKQKTTHNWGYMALRLPRQLPNMLLDAKANDGIFGSTTLPFVFRKDQRLSLEGDFDKYFSLYCPREYETDALYVFTPDLMALLIDESAAFDVEIIEDWMFLYSTKKIDIDDAATIQRIFRIIDTVGAKTRSQTRRYADDRIGDPAANIVAPQGQRLKKGYRGAGIVLAMVALVWIGQYIVGAVAQSLP